MALATSHTIEDVRLVRYVWIQPWSSSRKRFTLASSAITYGGYALLAWDYLLTLDDEVGSPSDDSMTSLTFSLQVTYIWESPCSVAKGLFIGNRYVNLLMQPINIIQTTKTLPLRSHIVSDTPK